MTPGDSPVVLFHSTCAGGTFHGDLWEGGRERGREGEVCDLALILCPKPIGLHINFQLL